jgi:peptidoglycan hydrolase FlgJ
MTMIASPSLSSPAEPAPASAAAYTDLRGLAALKSRNGHDPAALKLAAQQFEALFLEMMLKSMRDASLGDGILDSDAGNLYQDMFDKQVAVSMSAKGSIGITEMMMRQLAPQATLARSISDAATTPPAVALPSSSAGAAPAASSPEDFVAKILPLARRAAAALNVSPLGILAQVALETGWGRRLAKLADGSSAFNLFGIKAGESWGGKKVAADTIEVNDGVISRRREAFRAYESPADSVDDYVQLLKTSPRYRQALAVGQDAHAYAAGLARAGYATDPDYAKKVSEILDGDTLRRALGSLKD